MQHPGARRLQCGEDHIAVLTPQNSRHIHEDVRSLVGQLGIASSKAQGLATIITTWSSFTTGDNKIFLLTDDEKQCAVGFVKIGRRRLFLWDPTGSQREYNLICLLDFFVSPNSQRRGYGRVLIDRMLAEEGLEMKQLPIDKPSPMCYSFMRKHFGLENLVPQPNKFAVFREFFESDLPLLESASPMRTPRGISNLGRIVPAAVIRKPLVRTGMQPRRAGINPITWMPY